MEQLTNQSTNSISIKVSPRSAETITKCPQPTRSRADISFQWFKRLLKTFLFGCWDRGALWLTVKTAPHKFSYLLTYLALVASSCLALATYLVTQVTGCSNATDRQTDRHTDRYHQVSITWGTLNPAQSNTVYRVGYTGDSFLQVTRPNQQ